MKPDLGRLVVVAVDKYEVLRLRLADTDEEARVSLLVDEHIRLEGRPKPVTEDTRRAMVGVQADVEEMLRSRQTKRRFRRCRESRRRGRGRSRDRALKACRTQSQRRRATRHGADDRANDA